LSICCPTARVATIESAFIPVSEVTPGEEVAVRVFLRPYRGPRLERTFNLRIPADLARGEHRILLSDADTLNRIEGQAGSMNRSIDLPQIVSLAQPGAAPTTSCTSRWRKPAQTIYYDDKTLPSLPALGAERDAGRAVRPAAPSRIPGRAPRSRWRSPSITSSTAVTL